MAETARDNFDYSRKNKEPKKEGTYKGSVYFSAKRPKESKDTVTYDSKAYKEVMRAMQPGATKEEVGKAMVYLEKIGYYDGIVDSLKGKMFMGAGKRLETNKADDYFIEQAREWDFFKWMRGESKQK